ncbi:MAG: ABC transporter permease [Treponemataceae bacterium]
MEKDDNSYIITPNQLVFLRFKRNKLALTGLYTLLFMILFSFIGPFFHPYGEYSIFFIQDGVEIDQNVITDFSNQNIEILRRAPPIKNHLLGTDRDGRDVFIRLMYGGRISLIIGLGVIFLQLLLGVFLGGIAGFYGKWLDGLIMRIVDIFSCIPSLPIMLICSSIMITLKITQQHRIFYLVFLLGFLGWAGIARLVRGQILTLREREFMIAVKATGIHPLKQIFKHLIPNIMPQLIVIATLGIGSIILVESALSFLGFGLPFPYASWGNMVNAVNDPIILRKFLNIWVPPGVCILITVMSFNFICDGLRDAFDPKILR